MLSKTLEYQEEYFKTILYYITRERHKLEEGLQDLEDGVSIDSLFEEVCDRLAAVRKSVDRKRFHGNISELVIHVCDLEEKVWNGALHSNYFSDLFAEKHVIIRNPLKFMFVQKTITKLKQKG